MTPLTNIAIPADLSLHQLAAALATIGLKPTVGRSRILTFDRAEPAAPCRLPCSEPGCDRPALVSDAQASLCARHWLALRVPA